MKVIASAVVQTHCSAAETDRVNNLVAVSDPPVLGEAALFCGQIAMPLEVICIRQSKQHLGSIFKCWREKENYIYVNYIYTYKIICI